MGWFNGYGCLMLLVVMIPNMIYAVKCREGFENLWENKTVEMFEQIGRFGCFGLMMFNIPGTWFGFWFDGALKVYLIVDILLIIVYCSVWVVCFRADSVFRALALSILPSVLFLFSGIMLCSVPLIVAAVIFAPCHIIISYKNTIERMKRNYSIRPMTEAEYPLLENFLYEAIFIPEGMDAPPRSILQSPELQVYIAGFGREQDDHCMVAEVEGNVVGAVWVRMMDDYGHVDEQTPSLAISLYKEYRGLGIGTELMQKMLEYLGQKGYEKVSLSVQKENYAVNSVCSLTKNTDK